MSQHEPMLATRRYFDQIQFFRVAANLVALVFFGLDRDPAAFLHAALAAGSVFAWLTWRGGDRLTIIRVQAILFLLDCGATEYAITREVTAPGVTLLLPVVIVAMAFYLTRTTALALSSAFVVGHVILSALRGNGARELVLEGLLLAGTVGFVDWVITSVLRANQTFGRFIPGPIADRINAGIHHDKTPPLKREITVFFSDMRGFTSLVESLDPDEVYTIVNGYLSEMARVAIQHGGTVDKFVGDAVMVYFGAPDPIEPARGARAATAMATEMSLALESLNKALGRSIEVRMGIATGQAVIANFGWSGRMDYTAMGSVVNRASRIQSTAAPGRPRMDERTHALLGNGAATTDLGEVPLRGISKTERVFELLGPSPEDHVRVVGTVENPELSASS